MRWLISVPVWGERYVDEFCAVALPALQRAVLELQSSYGVDVRLVVHTDQPERVCGATCLTIESRPVPAGARDFDCMSQAHREVLALGMRGDVVVLLTAGAVISERGLVYCARVLGDPRLLAVLCAVPRVMSEGQLPDTADAQTFMDWAWAHRHSITQDCTWPDGHSADLSRTYFVGGGAVVSRVFLPHPLAVKIDGRLLRFTPTIDANLIHCFDPSEMYMVTDCRELALVKLTPADKSHNLVRASMAERAAAGELVVTDQHQRWCAGHRIFLRGTDPAGCEDWLFMGSVGVA